MISLTRTQLVTAFIALMLLRIAVGFHFFKEGTNKLKSGTFDAKYFLASAKGPLAPYFKSMLDDPDGRIKLCIAKPGDSDFADGVELNPEFTFLIWDNFVDEVSSYYGFGSPELEQEIAERRERLAKQITEARESGSATVDTDDLERQREIDERSILALRQQPRQAEAIFSDHKQQLVEFLDQYETDLISHFSTSDRLRGFAKDGQSREQVAIYVESLRDQVDTIRSDRQKQLSQWSAEVVGIWDSLEDQLNSLAVDKQAELPHYPIHRPFDQENSKIKVINKVIPWFDTIVGVLLIVGLFSRLAAGAAGLFLASVIATQPPFIPGTEPTYLYAIELAACLVIVATCAGRMGGLDYFFSPKPNPIED